MLSLIVYETLDLVTGVVWWITKNTGKGMYHGVSYIMYGNTTTEVDTNDLRLLTNQITELKMEILNMQQDKLNIREDNNYIIIDSKERYYSNIIDTVNDNPPKYSSIE